MRACVDACASGARTPGKIQEKTGISERHTSYALAAARTLGLVEGDKGGPSLTSLGKRMSATVPSSEEERLSLVAAVTESATLQALAPGLLGPSPLSNATLADHIAQVSGLPAETAAHRAAMILQWRTVLLEPQLRLFREPRAIEPTDGDDSVRPLT